MSTSQPATGLEPDEPDAPISTIQSSDVEPLHGSNFDSKDLASWLRRKKRARLRDLAQTLDVVIYSHIVLLYLLDNSFIISAVRCFIQLHYLTPIPSGASNRLASRQPFVAAIVAFDLLCIFYHLMFYEPDAPQATRGYMHGSLMIDLVGQRGPTSVLYLASLDVLVLGLQILALAVKAAKKSTKKKRDRHPRVIESASAVPNRRQTLELDAEERGMVDLEAADLPQQSNLQSEDAQVATDLIDSHRPSTILWEQVDSMHAGGVYIAEMYALDALLEAHDSHLDMIRTGLSGTGPQSSSSTRLGRSTWRLNLPFR